VPSLAEIQTGIRRALVAGGDPPIAALLTGGRNPLKRIQIHRRHYETSLVTALLGKFPATVWLVGSPFVTEAARHYIREYPPRKPCIAEYGEAFPEFLLTRPAAERVPYLADFATLEWHIGQVSIEVDQPAVPVDQRSSVPAEALPDAGMTMQTGLRYLHGSWPVDELMRLFLTDSAPDSLEFKPAEVWIEIRGARGEFRINRLTQGEFTFRRSVLECLSMGEAAEAALDTDATFDPGAALVRVVTEGLITGIQWHGPEVA
jgi:hypothetical protein